MRTANNQFQLPTLRNGSEFHIGILWWTSCRWGFKSINHPTHPNKCFFELSAVAETNQFPSPTLDTFGTKPDECRSCTSQSGGPKVRVSSTSDPDTFSNRKPPCFLRGNHHQEEAEPEKSDPNVMYKTGMFFPRNVLILGISLLLLTRLNPPFRSPGHSPGSACRSCTAARPRARTFRPSQGWRVRLAPGRSSKCLCSSPRCREAPGNPKRKRTSGLPRAKTDWHYFC